MKSSTKILTFFQNDQKQSRHTLAAGVPQVLTVGSKAGNVDVVLADALVSRVHAQVMWDGEGDCLVLDNGSTNGTFVNGRRVPPQVPQRLQTGDVVAFGNVKAGSMRLTESATEAETPPPPMAPATQSLMALLAHKPEISIGRSSECDVVIDSAMVSRVHAKLRKLPDGRVVLIDLGSTNGTFLNGERVQGNVTVQAGDKIIVGRSVMTLEGGARNLSGEIAIRTEAIQKTFANGKVGLQETTIEIPAGKLLAIMGPSGCGKSTLLKCLTGEAPATRGKVYLHNLELVQNYAFLKTLIGYVPQDDIVHKELTVAQALYYAARLRMEKPTHSQIEAKITDVLDRLRIAHIRHSRIAKISGGQRKRVSIAVELLTDPLILFLDEPTSPLDPQTIEEFLRILQELAQKGTTVVMVTHKPEDLDYMDEVIFMAEGGALVYQGSTTDYKRYFGVRTAVEVYANISGSRAAGWIQRYQGQHVAPKAVSQIENPRLKKRSNKNIFAELAWLSRRYLQIKTNDLLNLTILIGQAPIIGVLVCLIFTQITLSVPFLITLSAIWFGTSNAAREIVAEGAIYRRERMFNLRIGPYILSKLLVLGTFGLIQAILFSAIIHFGFQNTTPRWLDWGNTIGWVWILTICASVIGLTISALVDTSEKAMTVVPLVLIPQVMLAGVVARIDVQAVEVLSYLSPTRWGNEGLCLIQGTVWNARFDTTGLDTGGQWLMRENVDSIIPAREALEGQYHNSYETVFGGYAYSTELDFVALAAITFVLLVVVWGAMRRKDSI